MRFFTVVFIFALMALVMPLEHSAAYQSTITDVRIFHALPDVGEADFYINDVFAGTANYGGTAGYVVVQPGSVRIRAFTPASDPTSAIPLFEGIFDATEKLDWNVALVGTSTSVELKAFPVACEPLAFGRGRLNFVHTITGAAPLVVRATASDGTVTQIENVTFGVPQAIEVPAGIYTVNVEGVVSDITINVAAGTTGTAYIIGPSVNAPANVQVFFGPADSPEPAGFLRLVHAVPPVDIFLNDTLFAANVSPEQATFYIPLAPAIYDLKIFAAGSDVTTTSPLLTQSLEITDGVSTLGIVQAGVYGPSLTLFTEDRSAPAENEAKVNVINVGLPSVDLVADGTTVITGLAAGPGTFTLAEGTHELTVTTDGTPFETLSKFEITDDNSASLRTLIIISTKTIVLRGRPDLSE